MEILDISRTIDPGMPLHPGTVPPSQEWELRMDEGDQNNVSTWTLNSHTGTHVDARGRSKAFRPRRLDDGKPRPDAQRRALPGRGPDARGGAHTPGGPGGGRGLGRDAGAPRNTQLVPRPHAPGGVRRGLRRGSDGAARYLVEVGVGTVGVDYLSVEQFEDGEFHTHHALLEADVLVLEGLLLLSEAEPGSYLLACLPLKLAGSEGAPARAILIHNP